MAAVTAPSRGSLTGKSLLGKVALLAQARAAAKGRTSRLAALIKDHLLTVAALGAGVGDAFLHGGTLWGLGATTIALVVLDFKLQEL